MVEAASQRSSIFPPFGAFREHLMRRPADHDRWMIGGLGEEIERRPITDLGQRRHSLSRDIRIGARPHDSNQSRYCPIGTDFPQHLGDDKPAVRQLMIQCPDQLRLVVSQVCRSEVSTALRAQGDLAVDLRPAIGAKPGFLCFRLAPPRRRPRSRLPVRPMLGSTGEEATLDRLVGMTDQAVGQAEGQLAASLGGRLRHDWCRFLDLFRLSDRHRDGRVPARTEGDRGGLATCCGFFWGEVAPLLEADGYRPWEAER